jgi:hypothetical protein
MGPADSSGRDCVPAYDRAPLRDRFPKNHWQSPASWQGPPASPQAPIFQDPLPTATGYYAETGTGRDSGNLLLHPPLRFTKERGYGPVIEGPSIALVPPIGPGQRDSYRASQAFFLSNSPYRHVFFLSKSVFHDCVGIRKALKALSQVLDGRVGDYRRSSPRYSYSAGSAGLVYGTGYPTRSWGVVFGVRQVWQDVPQYKMIMLLVFGIIFSNLLSKLQCMIPQDNLNLYQMCVYCFWVRYVPQVIVWR